MITEGSSIRNQKSIAEKILDEIYALPVRDGIDIHEVSSRKGGIEERGWWVSFAGVRGGTNIIADGKTLEDSLYKLRNRLIDNFVDVSYDRKPREMDLPIHSGPGIFAEPVLFGSFRMSVQESIKSDEFDCGCELIAQVQCSTSGELEIVPQWLPCRTHAAAEKMERALFLELGTIYDILRRGRINIPLEVSNYLENRAENIESALK